MNETIEWTDAQSGAASGEAGFDVWGAAWRRKWMLLVVTIIATGLGYLYYLKAERVYSSSAQILLVKKEAALSSDNTSKSGRYTAYEDTLSTHMVLVRSPLIVAQAIEKRNLAELPSLRDAGDPAGRIVGGLKAARAGGREAPDPNVMVLTYEGLDPQDCEKILLAIVESYQDFLGTTYENISKETAQLITQAKDELHKQIAEKEAAYRKFREGAPLLWKGTEGANMHEARVAEIEKARSQTMLENAQTKARLEAIEAALARGGNREALALLIGNTEQRRTPQTRREAFEDRMFTILLEEQALLEQYGPDHPKIRTLQNKMNLVRAQLGGMSAEGLDRPVDFLALFIQSLKEELKIGDQKLAELDNLFAQEREAARTMSVEKLADEQYRAEIERMKEMFNQVIKRLQEINLLKDYSGISTRLIAAPQMGEQVKPKLAVALPIAGVLGLFVGFGLAYLAEIADKSFRSPEQIRRLLGLPVVAHIPTFRSKAGKAEANGQLARELCTVHQPRGRPAEAFRAVRTSLFFSAQNEEHKVIQVTSPNPGDGKTTLAANLAIAIADSGKKTLLVDGDLRRSRVHKLFGFDNKVGLSSVIKAEAEPPDAIQETTVTNLWAIPCGPRPDNPADLLTLPRFKEFLDLAREQYEFVVVDSPPLLAVTDPSVIAARADTVILAIRLSKHGRHDATRATEMLDSLGAKVLGVVVNAVGDTRKYGYGYGYGGYRYGYGYRYGHKYGYGYDYGGNGEYYEESAEEERAGPPEPAPDKPAAPPGKAAKKR